MHLRPAPEAGAAPLPVSCAVELSSDLALKELLLLESRNLMILLTCLLLLLELKTVFTC